ncbi:hypothetical protein NP233_g9747 [Leucocoprinus birnbaumii]|uniref:Uncharacterized protein n=1 Tax=Leucocoprinus birnbaumii TaxID=56174 RepID=A0AAD5VQD9_9AGAR|nr:hypothetical protein NP233_g9747 [Leucocoprinus birnbaumii]
MEDDGVKEVSPEDIGPPVTVAGMLEHLRHPDPPLKLHDWSEAQGMEPKKQWCELAAVYHPDIQPQNAKYKSKEWNLDVIKEICQIVTSIKK